MNWFLVGSGRNVISTTLRWRYCGEWSHENEKDTSLQALSPSDYKREGQMEKRAGKRGRNVSRKTVACYV